MPHWCISRSFAARAVALLFFPVAFFAATAPLPPAATNVAELRTQIEAHISQPRFSGALWGVKIKSLTTGHTLFEQHADRLLSPASNSKLYTAAMAFDLLGADHRIVTPIVATAKVGADGTLAGDVIVSGRGDPSWNARGAKKDFQSMFEPFLAAIEHAGIRHISGSVIADATFLRSPPNGAGWAADDLDEYYGAEISAITLDDNYAELRVDPAAIAGSPCAITWLQPHTGLVVDNRATTAAKGGTRTIVARRLIGENVVHLFGQLPTGDKPEIVDMTVPRPAAWFATALKAALIQRGIQVDGEARSVRWPDASPVTATCVTVGEISSPPLRELITALMKPSQNLETDLIFEYVGEKFRAADAPAWRTSEESGVLVLRDFLRKHDLPADEVRFEEGSGLSRNNLTTANASVALLTFMASHRAADDFLTALPIAGVDGTLARRMKGTPAAGNVHAKTGSLRWANSLSGYVTTAAGERLVFSLMLNRNGRQPAGRNVREELDDIAVMLARFAGRANDADSNGLKPTN